jgi:hypothetical protein
VSDNEKIQRLEEALSEHQRFNRIGNDLDSYLWNMAEWAFGREEKPNPESYGLTQQ